jgi:hypothetical protein
MCVLINSVSNMSLPRNITENFSAFPGEPVPSRQSIHYMGYKLKTTASLLDKRPDIKQTALTEYIGQHCARLEISPRKSLND